MAEMAVAVSRHDRVATCAWKHAPRKVSRSRVQLVAPDSLQHNFVEIDAWNHQSSDRRPLHWRRLGGGLAHCRGTRARHGPMCLIRLPLASGLVSPRDSNRILPADKRQQESTR